MPISSPTSPFSLVRRQKGGQVKFKITLSEWVYSSRMQQGSFKARMYEKFIIIIGLFKCLRAANLTEVQLPGKVLLITGATRWLWIHWKIHVLISVGKFNAGEFKNCVMVKLDEN